MIITSILDTDIYKLYMQQAIMATRSNTSSSDQPHGEYGDYHVRYQLIDRKGSLRTTDDCLVEAIRNEIYGMYQLRLTDDERIYIESLGIFSPEYLK